MAPLPEGGPDAGSIGPGSTMRDGGHAAPADAGHGERHDVLMPGTTWVSSLGDMAVIPVCFAPTRHREWDGTVACSAQRPGEDCDGVPLQGITDADLRDRLEALLRDTWERYARLRFDGFESCPVSFKTNTVEAGELPGRIVVSFTGEAVTRATTGLGKREIASDVHVSVPALRDSDPAAAREILREFGHVLGFPYEWLRGDQHAPGPCPPNMPGEPDAGTIIPPPIVIDPASVMDRCAAASKRRSLLSPGDVIGAQWIYGLKADGELVGKRGQCIGLPWSTASGLRASGHACSEQTEELWSRASVWPRFETSVPAGRRCLAGVVSADSGSAPGILVGAECSLSESQRIPMTGLEWRAMGNMCLAAVGDQIQLRDCDGSSAQKWDFFDGDPETPLVWRQIRAADGRCVSTRTTPDPGAVERELLTLKPCDAADPGQLFKYMGEGFIGIGSPPLCLDVGGGQPTPPGNLGLWSGCNNLRLNNGEFYASGPLRVLDRCISMDAHGTVAAEVCDESASDQIWDYHF